jgi:hypothetical protein
MSVQSLEIPSVVSRQASETVRHLGAHATLESRKASHVQRNESVF